MRSSRPTPFAVLAAAAALAGCGSDEDREPARSGALLVRANGAAALAPLPGGGLRFGELSGRIREVGPAGDVREVARVPVSVGAQRGLVGLAVDRAGRTYAAYTEAAPPRRIVVARIAPRRRRTVWRGPPSTELANGGHLAVAPDGRLTVGIGDLENRAAARDPEAPNGKLLALDPAGPPDQRPEVLAGGWNNPFAFAWTARGELWVADNAPGREPERIARADPGGRPVRRLRTRLVPSGLAALGGDTLALCGFRSRRLERVAIAGTGPARIVGAPLATDCSLGVARLADGRLAYATPDAIRVLDRP